MKIVQLFPGYGSQYVGMGKDLYDEYRIVQEYFEEASNCLNTNFVKLCFASSDVELGRMYNAYNATFLMSCSIVGLLREMGVEPSLVAGFNQGEYAALFAGGGMNFPDGLYLLSKYAGFYEVALEDMNVGMIRITGVEAHEIESACLQATTQHEQAFVAMYISPHKHIVAGHLGAIDRIQQSFSDKNDVSVIIEPSEVGLHCPLMNEVVANFKVYLAKVDFKDMGCPMIENVSGGHIQSSERVRDYVVRHINSPLNWSKVLDGLGGFDLCLEIGPGTTLSEMVKKRYPDKQILNVNSVADVEQLKGMLEL